MYRVIVLRHIECRDILRLHSCPITLRTASFKLQALRTSELMELCACSVSILNQDKVLYEGYAQYDDESKPTTNRAQLNHHRLWSTSVVCLPEIVSERTSCACSRYTQP